jgi:hypothetical protein
MIVKLFMIAACGRGTICAACAGTANSATGRRVLLGALGKRRAAGGSAKGNTVACVPTIPGAWGRPLPSPALSVVEW